MRLRDIGGEKPNQNATHVELLGEGLRTRVRIPPAPPISHLLVTVLRALTEPYSRVAANDPLRAVTYYRVGNLPQSSGRRRTPAYGKL